MSGSSWLKSGRETVLPPGKVMFEPSNNWQPVLAHHVLPAGCEVRMDLSTGKNMAKSKIFITDSHDFIPDRPMHSGPLKYLGLVILVCIAFAISSSYSETKPMVDYYKLLGVTSSDTTDTIAVAVKQAQSIYHPDRCEQSVTEQARCTRMFRKVTKAKKVLLSKDTRMRYDRERRSRGEQRAPWTQWAGAAVIIAGLAWVVVDPFGKKKEASDTEDEDDDLSEGEEEIYDLNEMSSIGVSSGTTRAPKMLTQRRQDTICSASLNLD